MVKRKPLSWKPVRRGAIFCSPACGRGCTLAEHNKAQRDATALCLTLGGVTTKWTPRVWENLGWHCGAISPCGRIKVYPLSIGYHAFIGSTDSTGGRWVESASTAKAAIRKVVARGIRERAEIDDLLRDLPYIGGRELVPPGARRG